jgi:hypothetical protein
MLALIRTLGHFDTQSPQPTLASSSGSSFSSFSVCCRHLGLFYFFPRASCDLVEIEQAAFFPPRVDFPADYVSMTTLLFPCGELP